MSVTTAAIKLLSFDRISEIDSNLYRDWYENRSNYATNY